MQALDPKYPTMQCSSNNITENGRQWPEAAEETLLGVIYF